MKFSKLSAVILAVTCTFTMAQETPQQLVVANLFATLSASLQPNLAFEKFTDSIRKTSFGTGFNVQLTSQLPSTLAFDYVSSGKAQMMWTQSAYFSAKEFAFTLLTYPPFITSERYFQWRGLPDTVKAVDSLYAKYGMKAIPCSAVDSNMDFVLRRIPETDYQFRGARVAMVGPLQEMYSASGIVPIAIPFGEMSRAMQAATIDGAYAWSPHESIELRLYESTKALIFPSTIRSFFAIDLLVNLKFWNGLAESDRNAIEGLCRKLVGETLASSRKLASDAVDRYKKAGIPVMPMPDIETEAIRQKWGEVAAKRAAFEPVFDQLFKSLYGK